MSIELPDGKVCRSLPEQVAENAKNIKTISEILDGLNIQDNLVVIADISQILTRSELDIVERPVAFLYYSDQLYIKKNEVGGSAFFDVIFSISGSTVISFASKEIEVNLSTGVLTLTTSTVSTYSKTELDTLISAKADITYVDAQLAGKADLSGANFTGAITAPSIIENMSGYSFSKPATDKGTFNYVYASVVKNGNKLTLVNAFTFIKNEGATGSVSTGRFFMPQTIIAAIYPFIGSYTVDARKISATPDGSNFVDVISQWVKYDINSLYSNISLSTLTAGVEYYFRQEITILLSDNMAA